MYVRNNRHSTFNAIIAARASNRVLCGTSAKTKKNRAKLYSKRFEAASGQGLVNISQHLWLARFQTANGQGMLFDLSAKSSEMKVCKNSHEALTTFAVALRASLILRH